MILMLLLKLVYITIPMLLSVAFLTIFERKVLGLTQNRKGPNKVYMMGLMQAFADVTKLFINEMKIPKKSLHMIFLMCPVLSVVLVIFLWSVVPFNYKQENFYYSVMPVILILSMSLYPLMLSGWSSMSSYASIGSLRGVAQTISYEIGLVVLILSLATLFNSMSMTEFKWDFIKSSILIVPIILTIVVTVVAETNRTPFDFSEGESELVSGFNVEYGSGPFSLIFMAEYSSILFFAFFTLILSGVVITSGVASLASSSLTIIWLWLRGSFPRYRYDKLMSLAWKSILPISLGILTYMVCSF